MTFIDSHAHLTSAEVLPHIEAILQRAQHCVSNIVNICTDPQTLSEGLLLQSQYPFIKNTGATTPHDVAAQGELAFPIFETAAREGKLCAIGETGLDYHHESSSQEIQRRFLKRYLRLATDTCLPVIFHCREAFEDLFSITSIEYDGPAVLHCFTGTMREAEEILKRGWFLSLSGIVTFKKNEQLRCVAKNVPLTQLLIETDTPYLAPQAHRGKPNEPSFLPEIARCIAHVKGVSVEEIARYTSSNAKTLFKFP